MLGFTIPRRPEILELWTLLQQFLLASRHGASPARPSSPGGISVNPTSFGTEGIKTAFPSRSMLEKLFHLDV